MSSDTDKQFDYWAENKPKLLRWIKDNSVNLDFSTVNFILVDIIDFYRHSIRWNQQ